MTKKYCSRKFGKTLVSINRHGYICIAGDWNTNWGCIYGHMIDQFKRGIKNPVTGFTVQVIGMDAQPVKSHLNYIYDKINKGYFDHLIKG